MCVMADAFCIRCYADEGLNFVHIIFLRCGVKLGDFLDFL